MLHSFSETESFVSQMNESQVRSLSRAPSFVTRGPYSTVGEGGAQVDSRHAKAAEGEGSGDWRYVSMYRRPAGRGPSGRELAHVHVGRQTKAGKIVTARLFVISILNRPALK